MHFNKRFAAFHLLVVFIFIADQSNSQILVDTLLGFGAPDVASFPTPGSHAVQAPAPFDALDIFPSPTPGSHAAQAPIPFGAPDVAPSLAPGSHAVQAPVPFDALNIAPSPTPGSHAAQAPASFGAPDVAPSPAPGSHEAQAPAPFGAPDVAPSPAPGSHAAQAPAPSGRIPNPGDDSPRVFDVTKYGALPYGQKDNKLVFKTAWTNACKYEGESTFLIPQGTFLVGQVVFVGPCYNQKTPKIEIRGTLKAPSNMSEFPTSTWITFHNLHEMNITGAGTGLLDGQGKTTYTSHSGCKGAGKCKNYPCSVRLVEVANGTISNIALLNSKGFHISIRSSQNILIHDINITAPGHSPNTDGVHISGSTNIKITSSNIGVGDDCISIGPGNANIDISKIHCGPGHGISVGSLGKFPHENDVIGVDVKNCTINGTTNGVRVKTWPGSPPSKASNITFEDIVMINVSNPILIDQQYCPGHSCMIIKPSFVKISDIHFKNIRGTSATNVSVKLACSSAVPCENIELVDIDLRYLNGEANSTCSNVEGTTSGTQYPKPCF